MVEAELNPFHPQGMGSIRLFEIGGSIAGDVGTHLSQLSNPGRGEVSGKCCRRDPLFRFQIDFNTKQFLCMSLLLHQPFI
jgi:hypothetical protein